jgi:hypothetical protein
MDTPKFKQLRVREPTQRETVRFLESIFYRYLERILNKVIYTYDVPPEDAAILHDKLLNMNLLELVEEEEDDQDQDQD